MSHAGQKTEGVIVPSHLMLGVLGRWGKFSSLYQLLFCARLVCNAVESI